MRSAATDGFWRAFERLPASVRSQAREAFRTFQANPFYTGLRFKKVDEPNVWSARIGIGYRALGIREADQITWFWIGSHGDYDKIV